MSNCNITSIELAKALEISTDELRNICTFFDKYDDDEWSLEEGIDYTIGAYGTKLFSPKGAVEICNYLIATKKRPVYTRVKRWVLQQDQRLKALMIAKQIEEARQTKGKLVFKNDRAFLSPRGCRDLLGLGTRQDILRDAFSNAIKDPNINKESIKIGVDFFEDEESTERRKKRLKREVKKDYYLTGTAITVVSRQLESRLTQEHRKKWMHDVKNFAPKVLAQLEKHEAERAIRIKQAKDRVKRRAKKICQITGLKQEDNRINLAVHHLFDVSTYPDLAETECNLLVMDERIHNEFHVWMGGTHVSCTVEDFEKFIEIFGDSYFQTVINGKPHPDIERATNVAIKLSEAKRILRQHL